MDWYRHLTSPVKVGDHILKNRLVSSDSLPNKVQGPESFPAEGFRALFSQIAKSAAIVTIAEWNNKDARKMPIAMAHQPVFDMDDPSVHNYFSMLADDIHFHGSKVIMSMRHEFPEGYSQHGGIVFGPKLFMLKPGEKPPMSEILPAERMHEVVDNFVKRVGWYLQHGFDGFSMRCDLALAKDLSPRTDQYGTDTLENRSRLVIETYKAIKEAYGGKCICEAVVAWEQPRGYGNSGTRGNGTTFEEVRDFLLLLDPYVDIVQVRENDGCRSHPHGYNFEPGDHPAVEACGRFKSAGIKALLEPIGGFQDPREMEAILETGKCDMFGAARAFFADYNYADKITEGRGEDIIPCILCNKCHGTAQFCTDHHLAVCSVNPRHSNDYYLHRMIKQDTVPKRIAVIGGGAAGMRSAIEAAYRGHHVTLFEKNDRLGGQLVHSEVYQFKWPIKRYKDWMEAQLKKLGVEIRLNTQPSRDDILKEHFDVVFAATGTAPVMPQSIAGIVDGSGEQLYHNCYDLFVQQPELGKHVVIVGSSETGLEAAIHLLRNGHDVTMLTRQKTIAHDNDVPMHYVTMGFSVWNEERGCYVESPVWAIYDNFKYLTEVSTISVKDNVVTYVDQGGATHTIAGNDVLICGGSKPLKEEALAYAGTAREFFAIGDCNGAGNIQRCNRQAFAAANRI